MPVTFRLLIQQTPIAGAPIMINAQTESTDSNGEVTASLVIDQDYTVSSGLDAISFPPVTDSGANFGAQNPVILEAQRLVQSGEAPCRIVIGGLPNIYFSSVNSTETALTVPLEYTELNSIYSVSGEAVPATSFAPGTSGFAVPEEYFKNGDTLMGVWKFLGQTVTVSANPDVCTDRGVPGECTPLDPAMLRSPFEYTRRVIIKLTQQANDAAKAGRWKGSKGQFSVPFLARGAGALAEMEKAFRDSNDQNFVCEVAPMSCVTKTVPKKQLLKAFKRIFEGKVPRGLEHIAARSPKEIAAFEKRLKKIPTTYTSCK
jgi:hypothetical protein